MPTALTAKKLDAAGALDGTPASALCEVVGEFDGVTNQAPQQLLLVTEAFGDGSAVAPGRVVRPTAGSFF